jgi:magnesium-transporting ATPase (P-type)
VQQAALTVESAPIAKDRVALPEGEVALGDRTNLVFQNTQVTRDSAAIVVTATGAAAVELHSLQRLLDTQSLSGGQWVVVLGLSLLIPAVVGVDKAIQLSRQRRAQPGRRMAGSEA